MGSEGGGAVRMGEAPRRWCGCGDGGGDGEWVRRRGQPLKTLLTKEIQAMVWDDEGSKERASRNRQ